MQLVIVSSCVYVQKLWELRERIPEALFAGRYTYMYDFTLPLEDYYQLVFDLRERLKGTQVFAVTGFGHLGIVSQNV